MGIKDTLIRLSETPAESVVSITGIRELCAENCRCITACDEDLAVLQLKGMSMRVVGTGLVLENFGAYGVRLTGRIHSVTFEESAGNSNDV